MFLTAPLQRRFEARRLLEQPLSTRWAAGAGLVVLFAGAAYCMGYALLSGGANEWARAIGWSAGAVLPWLGAFELIKRLERARAPFGWSATLLLLVAAGMFSLGLEAAIDNWIWGATPAPVPLQLLRRLPAVAVLLLLVLMRRSVQAQQARQEEERAAPALAGLRFVRAADNYVELHFVERMRMERETLSRMERRLSRHGFVRVHRSILVHPRHVTRLEPGGRTPSLVLDDGVRLPTGERYREALRHFVP